MRKRKLRTGNSSVKKEKAVMIASTVLVLTALTVTGVYVRNGSQETPNDGYTVDFSALDAETEEVAEAGDDVVVSDDDLDYDPASLEADSGKVKNTYGLGSVSPSEDLKETAGVDSLDKSMSLEDIPAVLDKEATEPKTPEAEEASSDTAVVAQPELHFAETDALMMPLSGAIIMNYSMDKSIYFQTLQQYKYNPAVVLGASVGSNVKAAANGKVIGIYNSPVTGNTVVMDIGDGYEVTYGQLADISVSEGSYVQQGEVFANVAEPTRYYTEEGSNLYLKMTKDGEPINPIAQE